MKEKINLKMQGHIKVTSNKGGIIFEDHNTIEVDALDILVSCLSQIGPTPRQVDTIVVAGVAIGSVPKLIEQATILDNTITFSTEFTESDFNGTIEDLELRAASVDDKLFSSKTGLNVFKDDQTRLRIDWTITINNC